MSMKRIEQKKTNRFVLLPIILVMGLVPLIVHEFTYDTGLTSFPWYPNGGGIETDLCLGWKMIAIIAVGVIMVGLLLYHYVKKKMSFSFETAWYFYCFYILFAVMAALFSPYKFWVLRGSYEIFEPIWVVLAYFVFCYYGYHFVREEQQVTFILGWAGVGAFGVSLIAIFQYFGMDFLRSKLGMHLIVAPDKWSSIEIKESSYVPVVSTLSNSNMFSFYFGMLVLLSFAMLFGAKKLYGKVYAGILFLMAGFCLYASNSTSGVAAVILSIAIVGLVLVSRKKVLAVGYVCVVLILVLIVGGFGRNRETFNRIYHDFVGTHYWGEEGFPVNEMRTKDDCIEMDINGNKVMISYTYGDVWDTFVISCKDENGKEIAREKREGDDISEWFVDEKYLQTRVWTEGGFGSSKLHVNVSYTSWVFTNELDGTYQYLNSVGKWVKTEEVKRVSLFREDAFSNRGRIWNKTIPMIPGHFLIGSGANTFLFEFPQNDYVYQNGLNMTTFVDVKAHSWYLQQMIETGGIGSLLLFVFLGCYVVRSVCIYRRVSLKESTVRIGIGLFAAVLEYLITAFANDSNVNTSPVFWCILGLGMAVNRMIVEQEKKKESA